MSNIEDANGVTDNIATASNGTSGIEEERAEKDTTTPSAEVVIEEGICDLVAEKDSSPTSPPVTASPPEKKSVSGSKTFERLYEKGKEKNTAVRLTEKEKKEITPQKRVSKIPAHSKSPNGLYERSMEQKKRLDGLRKEKEDSTTPTFKPELTARPKTSSNVSSSAQPAWERLYKKGEERKSMGALKASQKSTEDPPPRPKTNVKVSATGTQPAWERLYKQSEQKKSLTSSRDAEKGSEEASFASKKTPVKSDTGEPPRWQRLYEQGSRRNIDLKPSAATPPRPKTCPDVVTGSRLDELYRKGKDSNRRKSGLAKDHSRSRTEDEELAKHCTFRPTLVSSSKKKHTDCETSVASCGQDSLIGKSLEVDLHADVVDDMNEEHKLKFVVGASSTIDSSQRSVDDPTLSADPSAGADDLPFQALQVQ